MPVIFSECGPSLRRERESKGLACKWTRYGQIGTAISLLIPIRMLPPPLPRAGHNLLQLGIARLPAQFAANFVRAGHQHRRVTWPSCSILRRNGVPGHLACHLHYFAHAEPAPI